MHIAYCGPISLDILTELVTGSAQLPACYPYPLGAFLVKRYLDMGHRVSVVTSTFEFDAPRIWESGNLKIYASPRRNPRFQVLDAYRFERKWLVRHLREAKPDVVHAQWTYEFAHAGLQTGFPLLVTARDAPWTIFKHIRHPYRLFRAIYATWLLPKLPAVTAISPYMAEMLQGYRLKVEPKVVPNGLEDSFFVDQPRELSGRDNTKIISVTGWNKRKNPKTLLAAFALIRSQIPEARLEVIGLEMGEGEAAHRWAVSQSYSAGVHFLGHQNHSQVMNRLMAADVFLHSTLEESFCMTVLEAMAKSVPTVVLPDSGAVPWLIDQGRSGVIAADQSPSALADAVICLLDSPEEYSRISRNGLNRARDCFAMSNVAGLYLEHLRTYYENETQRPVID